MPATIGAFVLGCALGWSSPAFSSIKCDSDSENVSKKLVHCVHDDEAKWIGGLICIGALIASQVIVVT